MNIYTSYWANVRNFPPNLIGLNTTVWPPRWRPLGQDTRGVWVIDCPPLKPGKECEGLCQGKCAIPDTLHCAFMNTYYNQINSINFNDFINHLERLKSEICESENLNDVDFALIVFEAPNNPCSERWVLQDWLSKNGIKIEEWHKQS